MPDWNDSPFLLDKHKRGLPNLHRMARYPTSAPVDLVIVGAGAGGLTLAQRLARKGWRIVILEKGPFWDPDRDWVSDEKGASSLYWTDKRIVGVATRSTWARTTPASASAARWRTSPGTPRAFIRRTSRYARATASARTG